MVGDICFGGPGGFTAAYTPEFESVPKIAVIQKD